MKNPESIKLKFGTEVARMLMFMKQYKQELFLRRDTRQYRVKV